MDGHDRAAAFTAFEAALSVSPSSALTYILGSVILGWTGEAERAIEWGERGLRLSPLDPRAFAAFHSLTLGNFQQGRYEEAVRAAYKAVQSNPAHSISYMFWRRRSRSGAAGGGSGCCGTGLGTPAVIPLQPAICRGDRAPALAASLSEALSLTGLPE